MAHCSYKDCFNKTLPFSRIAFFSLPQDGRRRDWILNSGNKELINISATAKRVFCEQHFEEKFKRKQFNRTMLTRDAVPTPYAELNSENTNDLMESRKAILNTYKRKRTRDPDESDNEKIVYIEAEQISDNEEQQTEADASQKLDFEEEDELYVTETTIDTNGDYQAKTDCIIIDTRTELNESPSNKSPKRAKRIPIVSHRNKPQIRERYSPQEQRYSEDEHFVLSLIGPLQRLPAEKKALAKMKIFNFLYKLESNIDIDNLND